jgi:hypothetical protein
VAVTDERTFGGQTLVAPLRRVLVRAPDPTALARWRGFGWLAEPDPAIAAEQHEALCDLLRAAGAEVVYAGSDVGEDPDGVYVFDPVIVSDRGLLLRPGKGAVAAGHRRSPRTFGRSACRSRSRWRSPPPIGLDIEVSDC